MMKFGIFSINLSQDKSNKNEKNEIQLFLKYCAKLLEFDEGIVAAK